jgi:hypothetical protein
MCLTLSRRGAARKDLAVATGLGQIFFAKLTISPARLAPAGLMLA